MLYNKHSCDDISVTITDNGSTCLFFSVVETMKPIQKGAVYRLANLSLVSIILQHVGDLMQERPGILCLHLVWSCPLLVPVQAAGEISEQAVSTDVAEPVLIFSIRVLVEIEVQEYVLVSECVWMDLQRVIL